MADPFNLQPLPVLVEDAMITTAMELPNHRIVRNIGIVRGITLRVVDDLIARYVLGRLQGMFRGNTARSGSITNYLNNDPQSTSSSSRDSFIARCERARRESYDDMRRHAGQMGANAVVAVHYETTELMQRVIEVLCYGTAVVVEPRGG